MAVIYASDDSFKDLIKEKVIVDFFATWCGPCKMISPVIEQLSVKYPSINFIKVDVDKCPNISKEYGIMSVPTLLKIENGNIISSNLGFMNINELEKWLNE